MARFRKALIAAVFAAAGALAPFVSNGLTFGEILLIALTGVVTGVATYGIKNAGFVQLAPLAQLAEAAYTEYRRVRGGVAVDGSELPDWEALDYAIRSAWEKSLAAATETAPRKD
jgi:hypothetical protein